MERLTNKREADAQRMLNTYFGNMDVTIYRLSAKDGKI